MRSDGFFLFRALKEKERPVLWERRKDEFEDFFLKKQIPSLNFGIFRECGMFFSD
jgi:hypothetical protein